MLIAVGEFFRYILRRLTGAAPARTPTAPKSANTRESAFGSNSRQRTRTKSRRGYRSGLRQI